MDLSSHLSIAIILLDEHGYSFKIKTFLTYFEMIKDVMSCGFNVHNHFAVTLCAISLSNECCFIEKKLIVLLD